MSDQTTATVINERTREEWLACVEDHDSLYIKKFWRVEEVFEFDGEEWQSFSYYQGVSQRDYGTCSEETVRQAVLDADYIAFYEGQI